MDMYQPLDGAGAVAAANKGRVWKRKKEREYVVQEFVVLFLFFFDRRVGR